MKEEKKKKERRDRKTDTEDKSRAVSEDEGGLVQKMFTVLNNAGVVSVGHGIEPPGISHRPVGPVLKLGPGGATETRGRTQSVPFSATSGWSDATVWPSHEPLHSRVVFVR